MAHWWDKCRDRDSEWDKKRRMLVCASEKRNFRCKLLRSVVRSSVRLFGRRVHSHVVQNFTSSHIFHKHICVSRSHFSVLHYSVLNDNDDDDGADGDDETGNHTSTDISTLFIVYTHSHSLARFTLHLHYSHKIRTKTHAYNEHRRVGTHSSHCVCSVCIFSSWYISFRFRLKLRVTLLAHTTTCIFRVDSVFFCSLTHKISTHSSTHCFEILLCLLVCCLHTHWFGKSPFDLLQVKNRWRQTIHRIYRVQKPKINT